MSSDAFKVNNVMKAREFYEELKAAVDRNGPMTFDNAVIVMRYTCHAEDAEYVATVQTNDSIDNDPQFEKDRDVDITLTFDDFETVGHIERVEPTGRIVLRGDSKFAPMTFAEFLRQLGSVKSDAEMTVSVPRNPDMPFSQFDDIEIRAGRDANMLAGGGIRHVVYLSADGDFAATDGDIDAYAEEYSADISDIAFDKLARDSEDHDDGRHDMYV